MGSEELMSEMSNEWEKGYGANGWLFSEEDIEV